MRRVGLSERCFRALCFVCSALLLIAGLMNLAELAELNERLSAEESEINELERDIDTLSARCASSQPLGELERYAVEVLGMQHPYPEQTVELPSP